MDNKTILITGASSGIGETTAKYLNEKGMHTVLLGRNIERLEKLKDSLPSLCTVFSYNLMDVEHIDTIFETLKSQGILLDGLVHAAGVCYWEPLRVQKREHTRELLTLNVEVLLELIKYFSKPMYSKSDSSIVAISSLASVACDEGMSSYNAAKAAVNAVIKTTAKEVLKRKIRINAILPGIVDTPMTRNNNPYVDDDFEHYIQTNQPLGLIQPEQIAKLIEFLLGDSASGITGALIPVNGGMVV